MADKRFNNNLQGVLFKRVKDKDTSPDYGGECEIENKQYWISAWINQAKGQGQKFMALRFKLKELKQDTAQTVVPDFDDDIPF